MAAALVLYRRVNSVLMLTIFLCYYLGFGGEDMML